MKRSELEKHIGKSVEVKLFDGDTMQGILRKTGTEEVKNKPTIVCDKCHKSIGKIKPSYKKVGEIEYRYWRCRHCSTVYVISATDAELRKKIQEYQEFVDNYKDKEMPQEEMQKAQLILQTNVERSREIKEQYPLTLKPWER